MYVILILILAVLVMILISVAKVYRSVSLVELKRRARDGQRMAKSLYRVAAYKYSSQIFLLLLASIAAALFFSLVARKSPLWVALTADLALIWLAYVWIPRSSVNVVSQYFAQVLSKPLGWILEYIHPLLRHAHKNSNKSPHTGLYEKSDIVRLLTTQQKQEDNRIDEFEIELLKHVLNFGHFQVYDIMTPKRKVTAVSSGEILGPVVLSELHKTKHSYFPVYESKPSNIVGILNIVGIAPAKLSLAASELMTQSVYYVHEEQFLSEVLQVVIKTGQELFIVVDSSQEYTGIVTAREVLKALVGTQVTDEFDSYDNREKVANMFYTKDETSIVDSEEEQPEKDIPEEN